MILILWLPVASNLFTSVVENSSLPSIATFAELGREEISTKPDCSMRPLSVKLKPMAISVMIKTIAITAMSIKMSVAMIRALRIFLVFVFIL